MLLRSALLMGILSSFFFRGAGFGDVTLAANGGLLQFVYITAYALDGFGFAAETLVARSYGRRDPARVRRSAVLTGIWGAVIGFAAAGLFWSVGPALIDLMAKDSGVQEAARVYLPWMILTPIAGFAAFILDGVFVGAARGRDMRNMMALSFLCYWAAVAALVPAFGNDGLWIALLVSLVVRGVTLALRYPALERAAG